MTNEAKAKRTGKATVFSDLFHIMQYTTKLARALCHDESVTDKDIRLITLQPVLLNEPYNDLGLLVRDRLFILVEAQSTWSLNVLPRLLLYMAATMHEYITAHCKRSIYSSTRIHLPKPEFFVIYTGDRKNCPDEISLAADFWNDPNAAVDLKAKVLHRPHKDDIVGQYIMFCQILDTQIKLYGRTLKAITETIRICEDEGVLKNYLETRKKEVVSIMTTLFDQAYAVDSYANERYEEGQKYGALRGAVEMCQELGQSFDSAVSRLAKKFNLPLEIGRAHV